VSSEHGYTRSVYQSATSQVKRFSAKKMHPVDFFPVPNFLLLSFLFFFSSPLWKKFYSHPHRKHLFFFNSEIFSTAPFEKK
jgi:hypothetical protein